MVDLAHSVAPPSLIPVLWNIGILLHKQPWANISVPSVYFGIPLKVFVKVLSSCLNYRNSKVQQQPQVPQEPRIEDFGGETIPDCCQEHYGLLVIGEVLDDKKVKQLKEECCRDVYSGFHRFGLRWYKFR